MSFSEDLRPASRTRAGIVAAPSTLSSAGVGAFVGQPVDAGELREERRRAPLEPACGELASLVSVSMPRVRFDDLVIYETHRESLETMRNEQRERRRLAIHGLRPTRRLLLTGPTGTGRTSTASALAAELNLPLFTVRPERFASGGETQRARQLRLLAESMDRSRGVYVLDASSSERSVLTQCLTQLFLELEQDESDSPLVLVLNHEGQLEDRLIERFELSIHYFRPTRPVIEQLIRRRLQRFDTRGVSLTQIVARSGELNHAQITSACERAAKSAILRNSPYIEQADLLRALDDERGRVRRGAR